MLRSSLTNDASLEREAQANNPPDTPADRRALAGLMDELNSHGDTYPGTDLPVSDHLAENHSEATA